jgi:hypothetical protein
MRWPGVPKVSGAGGWPVPPRPWWWPGLAALPNVWHARICWLGGKESYTARRAAHPLVSAHARALFTSRSEGTDGTHQLVEVAE